MNEPTFTIINHEDRWRKGKEITENAIIELKKDSSINLEISDKGLSLKAGAKQGTYVTWAIDSTIPECVWHKIVVEAVYTEKAQVKLSYAISEKIIEDVAELQWSDEIVNPKDTLILGKKEQTQTGKYLWLKIVLDATKATKMPVVKSVKLYFPRVTYLRYLPEIYQEEPKSREFLERYLSVFETILTALEQNIGDTPRIFDAFGTASGFLPWLSTWLGAVKDENWDDDKWREFLSRAATLYKQRGTSVGLSELIKLYSGKYPIIVERSLLKCEDTEYSRLLTRIFGCAYSFCVLVEPDQVKTEKDRKVLKRMVATEKPAHTLGGLVVLEPWIRLDWHCYLGKNSFLNIPLNTRVCEAVLSVSTILEAETKSSDQNTEEADRLSTERMQIIERIRKGQKLCRFCFETE